MSRRPPGPALILGLFLLALPGLAQESGTTASPAAAAEDAAAERAPTRVSRAQGRLFLDRRTDVVGATVRVESQDRPGEFYLTSSDGDGVFRVEGLQDGQYRLRIGREGLKSIRKDDVTVKFPFRAVVELPMEAGEDPAGETVAAAQTATAPVRVVGQAMIPTGEALAEARVRLVRPDGSEEPRLAISDDEGRFEIDSLPAGDWQLTARAVGMLTLRDRLRLGGDASLRIAMVQQPADYDPSPLDLMPREQPLVPASLLMVVEPAGRESTDDASADPSADGNEAGDAPPPA